jgi:oligopeptide transport system permease protein
MDRAKTQGVSLGQDAWRRLRRNRVAMIALGTLAVICTLAVFTPLLPLDPPDRDQTKRQYEPPRLLPLVEPSFALDMDHIRHTPAAVEAARERLNTAKADLAAADTEGSADTARELIRRRRAEISALVQRPYRDAGFPELGPLARVMVRLRHELFGRWSIGPLCGRDLLGRDLLSRLFWGARVSIIVGVVATLVSLVIGVAWGAIAGYAGGLVDNVMMRAVDVLYSIPFIFVVIFIITILSERNVKLSLEVWGIDRITIFFLVVGAIYWLTMARVVRGQVISLKHEPFVEAARALGVSRPRVIFRHILPNLFSIVIVYLTLTIPRVMLFEAFLSFLGLGVEPPDVSWGLLANEGIKVINPVKIYWWLIMFPSIALGATLFSLNFLGDGLRDALDPKMRTL